MRRKIYESIMKTVLGERVKPRKGDPLHAPAETIIRNHVVWSMGAGFIPIMIGDILAVCALQLDMIRQLSGVYGVDFEETKGKALVTSLTGTTVARLGARSLIKMIPGVGYIIGGATVSLFAGASTYALGEVFKIHFESGGTIANFETDKVKDFYKEKFEEGKKVAKQWKKKHDEMEEDTNPETSEAPLAETTKTEVPKTKKASPPTENPPTETDSNDPLKRLRKLGELKEAGLITQKEFNKMKKKIISEF